MVGSKSRGVWGHTGQHSPGGTWGFSHSSRSWHWISSQRIAPLSQTQIWHGEGFQMSLFRYICPFWVQAISSPSSPGTEERTYSTFSNHEIKGMGLDKDGAHLEMTSSIKYTEKPLHQHSWSWWQGLLGQVSFLSYHLIFLSERSTIESPIPPQYHWNFVSWVFGCHSAQRGVATTLRSSCQLPAL